MATLPFTITPQAGQPFTIYAEEDNINYFLNTPLTADTVDGPSNESATVGAYTRRSYPGDATPVNVSGSTREFLVDPSRKSGNALPGRSFMLVAKDAQGVVTEKRQFTFKGRLIDLHAFLTGDVAFDTYLYMNSGARYTLAAAV